MEENASLFTSDTTTPCNFNITEDTLDLDINSQCKSNSKILSGINSQSKCKAQPRRALLGYPFHNTAAHMEAMPTREGI